MDSITRSPRSPWTPTSLRALPISPSPVRAGGDGEDVPVHVARLDSLEPLSSPAAHRSPHHQRRPHSAASGSYTVRPGDNLFDIAARTLGDPSRWQEIYALNRDQLASPRLIQSGMRLRLPGHGDSASVETPEAPRPVAKQKPQDATSRAPAPQAQHGQSQRVRQSLLTHLRNGYRGVRHQCFNFAWSTVTKAGGKPISSAQESHTGRNHTIVYLETLIDQGRLKVGDVIYANRRPGADPSSTNLAYGPHWFVYVGKGQFADQYGTRDAQAMQEFVPGRKIDAIFHSFH